jgi:hypothetical protein
MKTIIAAAESDTTPIKSRRDANVSPDGKWHSFSKVPISVRYVNTGVYFGRVKMEGKIFRESLQAQVFTTAKLRVCRAKSDGREQGGPQFGQVGRRGFH